MYGIGILRGLKVTIKHMIDTYLDDIKLGKKRYYTDEGVQHRSSVNTRGIFTIQYPEERLAVPEEYRFTPFLVYDVLADGQKKLRCTACGICAKVCPPQCIWIVRKTDPTTGRPVPSPSEFYIDVDICMNCGSCAEFCPFDSIKMDHDFQIASFDRMKNNIHDLERLSKPASYYKEIRPLNYALEEAARLEKEARSAKKPAAS